MWSSFSRLIFLVENALIDTINMILFFCCVFTVWLQQAGAECPPIISRAEWDGAKPQHVHYLATPVDLVIIQHTVTQTCSNDKSCAELVRDIQKTHMDKVILWDIGPSFLVASTGKIYEGRGWNHVGVHTYGYNNHSVGIAFLGNFNNQEPTTSALDAAKALIKCGIDEERLTTDHKVVVHSQLLPTDSPGKLLTNKIKLWPDWIEDVTDIKKLADVQDIKNEPTLKEVEDDLLTSRDATREAGSARTKRQVLTTPKEVDLLSVKRDTISELIDNLRDLAQQTLKTVEAFTRGVSKQFNMFIENIISGLRKHKNNVSAAIAGISLLPGLQQCTKPIQDRANNIYDNTESKAKECGQQRVQEVDSMIKNLGMLSSDSINFANTAVEQTRNCTELNFGIQPTTKACLNSVTTQTQSATATFETQRTLLINSIKSAVDALPAALQLCARKPLLDAGTETTKVIGDITNCKPSWSIGWP